MRKNKPDFICIGATKAGTTWLYDRLNELEYVAMPLRKEISYFDRHEELIRTHSNLEVTDLRDRLKNLSWVKKAVFNTIKRGWKNKKALRFWFHWYFSDYNDTWYIGLFDRQKISGDVTSSYAVLDVECFRRIQSINSKVKIIYLLRNPVERDWSEFKMMSDDQSINSIDSAMYYLEQEMVTKRSDYLGNIKRLLQVFERDQILIGFYDAISDRPLEFFKEVLEFLGVMYESEEFNTSIDLNQFSNRGKSKPIPGTVESLLRIKYEKQISRCTELFGSYSADWLGNEEGESSLIKRATIRLSDIPDAVVNKLYSYSLD